MSAFQVDYVFFSQTTMRLQKRILFFPLLDKFDYKYTLLCDKWTINIFNSKTNSVLGNMFYTNVYCYNYTKFYFILL